MKDKEFDNILDECLERLLKGESLEHCLKLYPEQAAELKPLLQTALAVKETSAVEPRPEFKARARYQFRSALGEKASQRPPFFSWLPRWATALAIVLIVLLAGGGTVAAASNSMPDSFLYPVKLATESVQLALTPSELARARLCASFADRRVAEIVYMADRGDAHQVEVLTGRLDDHLERLAALASELGEDESKAGEAMLSVPNAGAGGEEAPPPTAPLPPQEGVDQGQPRNQAELWVTVAGSASSNQMVMEAMLDEVPQAVKDALLEAISVLEEGYARVLQALE